MYDFKNVNHPAKYSQEFIPIFFKELKEYNNVLDPFAGTGRIGLIKNYGFTGKIYANELEPEWLKENKYNCDVLTYCDAEFLPYESSFFDAICTSPTYGNRMADCHNAKDNSKRNTYTHCLGHKLNDENTGKLQWGNKYREKHQKIYKELYRVLKDNGIFVINISNHIRKGVEIDVCGWTTECLQAIGFVNIKEYNIKTKRNKFGRNGNVRVENEKIIIFKKESKV